MDPSPSSPRMNPLGRFTRATTFSEGWDHRRNSTLSDSLSEARNSIRSSTDDIFLPRVSKSHTLEESHWHSTPLGLALLPAIAGIFFQNGSAFVTDVTLLVLAAIFLNWSVRLPWDWYRSAQAIRRASGFPNPADQPFDQDSDSESKHENDHDHKNKDDEAKTKAAKELQIHELAALAACFIFPIIGTCLLHAIRSSLSRPSEGLVSNYNLTIFLLASEVRPVSHILRLIQKRTLHLQRVVTTPSHPPTPEQRPDPTEPSIKDLHTRISELESHIASHIASASANDQTDATSIRNSIQPEIEALNRAVRRYEKRSALFTLQTDARFARIEARAGDALALAAALQRREAARRGYALVLLEWGCACVVVPVRAVGSLLGLPGRAVAGGLDAVRELVGWKGKGRVGGSRGKSMSRSGGKGDVGYVARTGVKKRPKEAVVGLKVH